MIVSGVDERYLSAALRPSAGECRETGNGNGNRKSRICVHPVFSSGERGHSHPHLPASSQSYSKPKWSSVAPQSQPTSSPSGPYCIRCSGDDIQHLVLTACPLPPSCHNHNLAAVILSPYDSPGLYRSLYAFFLALRLGVAPALRLLALGRIALQDFAVNHKLQEASCDYLYCQDT